MHVHYVTSLTKEYCYVATFPTAGRTRILIVIFGHSHIKWSTSSKNCTFLSQNVDY